MSQPLSLEELVDEQSFSRFNLMILIWSFLALLADGFDLAALASAAPALGRAWQIARADFAPALSASVFGILLGAPLLGVAGDRYGRKPAILASCVVYSLCTLSVVWARNLDQVMILRALAGIGLGGLMPNLIALNSEFAPRRLRATLVVLMFAGISVGGGLPGAVQAWLIPKFGWQIMFWIGGLAPLALTAALLFSLPESVRFLAQRKERRAELITIVRAMRRDLSVEDDVQFRVADASAGGSGLQRIFRGSLAWITPLMWVCFASALMANFFLNSWLPLVLESDGLTPQRTGIAISLYHYGGVLGGLLVSLVLRPLGFAAMALLFLFATLAIAAIGTPGISYTTLVAFVSLAGFCTLGSQFGNNAAAGLLYPAAFRSRGVGWALGIGRVGSIAGPLVGGMLIARQLPPEKLFLMASLPMVVGMVAAALVAGLSYKNLGSTKLDEIREE